MIQPKVAVIFEPVWRTVEAMANPFTTHPESAGETYVEHMRVAFGIGRQLMGASLAAFVHGVLPMTNTTRASDKIRALNACLENHDRDGLRRGADVIDINRRSA